jgi:hypothetical protein
MRSTAPNPDFLNRNLALLSINPEPFDRFKALSLSKGLSRALDRGVEGLSFWGSA